jgi:DNA-binding transcriptional ArsR family regulator
MSLSTDATKLLMSGLGSVERLEIFSMLARARGHAASIADLARDARLPPAIAKRVVGELELANLVETTSRGLVRVAIRDRDIAPANEILAMYAEQPTAITALLAGRR